MAIDLLYIVSFEKITLFLLISFKFGFISDLKFIFRLRKKKEWGEA